MGCLGDGRIGVAADKFIVGQHSFSGKQPLIDGDIGRLSVDLDHRKGRRASRDIARDRDDGKNRLTVKHHVPGRKRRLVGIVG